MTTVSKNQSGLEDILEDVRGAIRLRATQIRLTRTAKTGRWLIEADFTPDTSEEPHAMNDHLERALDLPSGAYLSVPTNQIEPG